MSIELRRKLKDSANRHRRSLSEEAKRLLDGALADVKVSKPLGSALVAHFRPAGGVDLDIPREEMPEAPPELE